MTDDRRDAGAERPEGFRRVAEHLRVAGHPNGVFRLSPAQLVALAGAPVEDVTP